MPGTPGLQSGTLRSQGQNTACMERSVGIHPAVSQEEESRREARDTGGRAGVFLFVLMGRTVILCSAQGSGEWGREVSEVLPALWSQ